MRIKENDFYGSEFYSPERSEQVKAIFAEAVQIYEEKRILAEIKRASTELRNLFWTEEEQNQKKETADFFNARMQSMVYYTIKNLEGYQESGWKELIYEGENHGTEDAI